MSNTAPVLVSRLSPRVALLLSLALVAGFSVWLVLAYGLEGYTVQLVPGFAAALLAFVIALAWERAREAKQLADSAERLVDEQTTEVRRRLATVREELRENRESLEFIHADIQPGAILNVALRKGAWTASAPSLGELVADYEFTADLARYYDRIEEVRWRLRLHMQLDYGYEDLDEMTRELAGALVADTDPLIEDIDAEIDNPNVQVRGLIHRASMEARVGTRATIEAKVIQGNKESSGPDGEPNA
jgi:hypothetical protein